MVRLSHGCLARTLRRLELAQLYISTCLVRVFRVEHRPSTTRLHSIRATGVPRQSPCECEYRWHRCWPWKTTITLAPPSFTHNEPSFAHCTKPFYSINLNVLRCISGIACGRDADPLYTLVLSQNVRGVL